MSSGAVLVTSRSFSTGSIDVRARLEAEGYDVVTRPSDHRLADVAPVLATAVAWIAGTGPVADAHLAAAPQLKVVARYGVGVDAVDIEAAGRRGVLVANTPGANSDAVADHAVALMLAALRGVVAADRRVRQGDWSVTRSRELGSLTVGIVGFGRIGRGVAQRLSGFGTRIIVHDPWVPEDAIRAIGAERVSLAEMASMADLITLHTPGEQQLIDADWLSGAKTGMILVNTARATLVDEAALTQAITAGTVAHYAADTLASENGAAPGPLLAAMLADSTVFTPHIAAQTVEAVDNMGVGAAEAVLAVLHGKSPINVVSS